VALLLLLLLQGRQRRRRPPQAAVVGAAAAAAGVHPAVQLLQQLALNQEADRKHVGTKLTEPSDLQQQQQWQQQRQQQWQQQWQRFQALLLHI
jgi:hypothetical protein